MGITAAAIASSGSGGGGNSTIVGPLGSKLSAASVSVVVASDQGAIPVTGTFWQTTQPVSLATLPSLVAGTAVIGHVIVDSAPSTAVTGTVTANAGTGTFAENLTQVGGSAIALGQALAAASLPVVLTAAQLSTLTPPAAITNFAQETGGNLATLAGAITSAVMQINNKQINGVVPLMGNGVTGTGSQRVTIASDNTAFSVNATLSAETTKVIGVTRTADGSGNLINSTNNYLQVTDARAAVGNAQTNVTTAGTRVQLASNTCSSVVIKAKGTNTGNIYVGGSAVASSNGFILAANESIAMDITNTNLIYIDSAVNGEGVSFFFIN